MFWYIRVVRCAAFIVLTACLLFSALVILFTEPVSAATGINKQVNYQARLLDNSGGVVPDGTYNVEFKIYQDGNGCVSSGSAPCGGTLLWTETRTTANRVTVINGYFSVMLGEVTAFGTSVDWNQDTLWLSINIGGTDVSPSWDGEMTPFRRFAAAPYAMNSQQLGGLNWDKFIQLAPSAVQTDSSTLNSISINKTGASGSILQLQKNGSNVAVIDNSGSVLSAAFDTISAGTLSIGATNSNAVTIGNTTNNTPITMNSGTGAINIGTGAQARTVNIGTGGAAQTLNLGSSNTSSAVSLVGGNHSFTVQDGAARILGPGSNGSQGSLTFGTNSTSASRVRDLGGFLEIFGYGLIEFNVFNGDTAMTINSDGAIRLAESGGTVTIGVSDTTASLLILDTKTSSGDVGSTNGSMYYNSSTGKIRCREGGSWKNCITGSTAFKTATQSSSSTTLASVTDVSIPILSATSYNFTCRIIYSSASTTSGLAVAVAASAASITYSATIPQAASGTAGAFNGWATTSGGAITATGTPAITNNYLAIINGYVTTTTAASLVLQFARGGATVANITIQPGTSCTVTQQ